MDALATAAAAILAQYGPVGVAIGLIITVLIWLQAEGRKMRQEGSDLRDELRADLQAAREELRARRTVPGPDDEDEPRMEGHA